METRLSAAPITGAPTFEMELLMSIPRQTQISKLREQLGRLCDELNIDWQLSAM
jgi:glycine cleavage system regulatory protein